MKLAPLKYGPIEYQLLIVPVGIEIRDFDRLGSAITLLIVPVGIEISLLRCEVDTVLILLIVPVGIEIEAAWIFCQETITFNRTSRN